MIKFISCLLLLILTQQCSDRGKSNQNHDVSVKPIPYAALPEKLDESSGLAVLNNRIYSLNDHGGKPLLFAMDLKGKLHKKIKINNAKNRDWESLAINNKYLFIGDFGNNDGDRDDLSVYYIPLQDLSKKKIMANQIKFEYQDKSKNKSHNAEALIALEEELIIFTKDQYKLTTQVYHLPIKSENEIQKIEAIESKFMDALVTGATYNSKAQRLVLCGYQDQKNYVWVFDQSTPQKLLSETYQKIYLEGIDQAQIEAVSFLNPNQVLISTEKTKAFKPQLWQVNINP